MVFIGHKDNTLFRAHGFQTQVNRLTDLDSTERGEIPAMLFVPGSSISMMATAGEAQPVLPERAIAGSCLIENIGTMNYK